jgi:undecaprenyl-diphosphatase
VIAALAGLAVLFLLIAWQVQSDGWLVWFDGVVNAGLAGLRSRPALAAGAWISQIGTGAAGAILCVVASGLFWSGGRTRYILPIWLTFVGAQATTWSLKFVTDRARPHFIEGITAASPSFPSAHATVSMAVYLFLALAVAQGVAHGRGAVLAFAALLILCICFSRMLLSLHYFSDVLAGATVGLFWALIGFRLAIG